jgi:2-dehydropantoate 2-reductase
MKSKTPRVENAQPWYVLGAGAMGCLWAVAIKQYLKTLPQPVTLLLRDDNALRSYPGKLSITRSSIGATHSEVIPALSLAHASPATLSIKRLLLTCKAQDAEAAMANVSALLDDQAIVVVLQNGIHFQQQLSSRRAAGTVFCLSTSFGAWLREPFSTVAAGEGESWLGQLPSNSDDVLPTAQLQLLAELPSAAMNIKLDHTMHQRLWHKLAINCAINGLTVIYNCRNGELLSIPAANQHCQQLCEEISTLMRAIPNAPEMQDLWQQVQQVARATEHNISSTLQDIRRQRSTEIEHLNGYLCQLAAQQQLPCPLNQQVVMAVLESARPSSQSL